jgi:hypothetical protein
MSPLGLIIAGPIADNLGVQTWFMIGGIVTLLMGITSLFIPAIMNFEHSRTPVIPAVAQKSVLSDLDLAEEQVEKLPNPFPLKWIAPDCILQLRQNRALPKRRSPVFISINIRFTTTL